MKPQWQRQIDRVVEDWRAKRDGTTFTRQSSRRFRAKLEKLDTAAHRALVDLRRYGNELVALPADAAVWDSHWAALWALRERYLAFYAEPGKQAGRPPLAVLRAIQAIAATYDIGPAATARYLIEHVGPALASEERDSLYTTAVDNVDETVRMLARRLTMVKQSAKR